MLSHRKNEYDSIVWTKSDKGTILLFWCFEVFGILLSITYSGWWFQRAQGEVLLYVIDKKTWAFMWVYWKRYQQTTNNKTE